jgi:LAO/AO transport system ATPase
VIELLHQAQLDDVAVLVGGIIPEADVPKLTALGVVRVFGPGTSLDEIVACVKEPRPRAAPDQPAGKPAANRRRILARQLTRIAQGETIPGLATAQRRAPVIAVTGSPGVGKSTLVGKLIERLRQRGQSVAVLACDPQSPLTGGALLGDRFRMTGAADDGVFIRSLATPGGQGAVAAHLAPMCRALSEHGFDRIIVETVGAGQGDTAVRDAAGTVVLLVQPEAGDQLQWEKAGLLEIADVIVVHKADLPGAEQTAAQLRTSLELSKQSAPVLLVSSKTGQGLDELVNQLNP